MRLLKVMPLGFLRDLEDTKGQGAGDGEEEEDGEIEAEDGDEDTLRVLSKLEDQLAVIFVVELTPAILGKISFELDSFRCL